MRNRHLLLALFAGAVAGTTQAATTITLHEATDEGPGDSVGTVTVTESEYGLVFTPDLKDLDEGIHGFHVHQNPTCQPGEKDGDTVPALAAGGHFDPDNSGRHGTPWGDGHLGDLPALYVDDEGRATLPVLAPRLEMDDLKGRAVMVHAGGDNYSDQPKPLGGGGPRMACGVVADSPFFPTRTENTGLSPVFFCALGHELPMR